MTNARVAAGEKRSASSIDMTIGGCPFEEAGLVEQQADDDDRDEGGGGVPHNRPHRGDVVQRHRAQRQGQQCAEAGAPADAQAAGLPDDQGQGEQENSDGSQHRGAPGSAAGSSTNGATVHVVQACGVVLEPVGIGAQRHLQQVVHPAGQLRVETVIDPLPLAAVEQQAAGTQLRQVTADLGLAVAQGTHQLAHAQLALLCDQQRSASAGFVGQALEQLGWGNHCGRPLHMDNRIYGYPYVICNRIFQRLPSTSPAR
uniref:Uncharacterized protein n=1 Tax=Steinernema glaseri TaxID=37863 RepID=A0A1I8AF93_9BILA